MRIWFAELVLTSLVSACGGSPQGKPAQDQTSAADGPSAGPPARAIGFDFGAAPAEVKNACKGAGKAWSAYNEESGTCTGPVAEFGVDATVRIDFCNKKGCVVSLEHRPQGNWLATFNGVKEKLAKMYGTPALMPTKGIPATCRSEAQFARCLEAEELRLMYRWEWPTRHQVILTIGKPEQDAGPAALRIKYLAPPQG